MADIAVKLSKDDIDRLTTSVVGLIEVSIRDVEMQLHDLARRIEEYASNVSNHRSGSVGPIGSVASQPANDPHPQILTHAEASRMLKVSERTLRRWRDEGKVPFDIEERGQRHRVLYKLKDVLDVCARKRGQKDV